MLTKRILQDIEKEILPEFKSEILNLSGKTILLTGGNSLLASYLVDSLVLCNSSLQNKIKLIIINKNPMTSDSRLSHLLKDENVKFIQQDVGRPFSLPYKIDIIIHAASRSNPQAFKEDPVDTILANTQGLYHLLEYAKLHKVEQFLFFSSGEIYGNPSDIQTSLTPTSESFSSVILPPEDLRVSYIHAKRLSEALGFAYNKQHNVPFKSARIMLGYGPGIRDDGKVISDFFNSAINKNEITIWDHGDATRVFAYVSDVARALFYILFKGEDGQAYNIGGNNEELISIKNLADTIASVVSEKKGTPVPVIPNIKNRSPREIPDTRNLNIEKIKALGFSPKVPLQEGLGRLLEHYTEQGKFNERF